MCSQTWREVYRMIQVIDKQIPRPKRRPDYSDVQIVAMFLWSVAHDRPQSWACRRDSYGSLFRPRRLPSVSRFNRRIRGERCHRILEALCRRSGEIDRSTPVAYLDARPLVVGACSKDRDARAGRVYGGFARGYKLHQIVAEDGRVLCWSITSLNVSEPAEALELVEATSLGDVLLADSNYDSNALFEAAEAKGCMLIAAIRPTRCRRSPRPNRNSPARIRAVHAWRYGVAPYVHRDRRKVELFFAQQSNYAGSLAPLPAWVRTLPRVRRWVGAKLILHHIRLKNRSLAA